MNSRFVTRMIAIALGKQARQKARAETMLGADALREYVVATAMVERQPRKNLFLSATAEAGSVTAPVRIRNLSERGAMIDGPALPDVGSTFVLRRLEIAIGAQVVWNMNGRCGLRLDGTVSIDDWVAGVKQPERFGSLGQTRVDAIQAALRQGEELPADDCLLVSDDSTAEQIDSRIAAELALVRSMLNAVADELTEDMDVLMRHEQALQNFDVATQIIEHLASVVSSADRKSAVAAVPMHDLRNRLRGTLSLK